MGSSRDQLSYAYKTTSNQLAAVTDNSGSSAFAQSSSYSYDPNGNLITDAAKSISGIDYNYLNLPNKVRKSGGDVTYTYSASGHKLRADFGNGKVYDYVAGLVYQNNQLEFILSAEGRVLPPGQASTTVTI